MDSREFLIKWFWGVEEALKAAGAPKECLEDLKSVGINEQDCVEYWRKLNNLE